jgi:hypothetical protein
VAGGHTLPFPIAIQCVNATVVLEVHDSLHPLANYLAVSRLSIAEFMDGLDDQDNFNRACELMDEHTALFYTVLRGYHCSIFVEG